MTVRALLNRLRTPVFDPPEEWEPEMDAREAMRVNRGGLAGHPYRPVRWEDVPAGAGAALADACGAQTLDRLFVVPADARMIDSRRRRFVATPTQVLGLGEQGVALWLEQPSGVVAEIPLDELAAIDDVQVLLYVRLMFFARGRQLTIRFNAVARHQMEDALSAVRGAASGDPLPVPDVEVPQLPDRWQRRADAPSVRVNEGEPTALLFGTLAKTGWRQRPRPALVALTAHELIVLREPDSQRGAVMPYGVDALRVPRRRLAGVQSHEAGVRLLASGVALDVPLGTELAHGLQRLLERCTP